MPPEDGYAATEDRFLPAFREARNLEVRVQSAPLPVARPDFFRASFDAQMPCGVFLPGEPDADVILSARPSAGRLAIIAPD